jgi:hypothetical protein
MTSIYFSRRYYDFVKKSGNNYVKKSGDDKNIHSILPYYFSRNYKPEYTFFEERFCGMYIEKCGVFRVEYYLENAEPLDVCCFSSWRNSSLFDDNNNGIATFYKNDEIIFTKENLSTVPCILLHGDGQTENGTFFLIKDRAGPYLTINNMHNQPIRTTLLSAFELLDVKRLNSKFAVSIGEEICTHDRITGLINLDILFSQDGMEEQIRPYDNSRVHVPINWDTYSDDILYMPVSSNDIGFTVLNVFTKEIYPRIITYEEAFNEDFEFYENLDENENEDKNINMLCDLLNLKNINKDY